MSDCKKCQHSYNDWSEGWLCRKYDGKIVLSSGAILDWPGQPIAKAYANDCHGDGYARSAIGFFKRFIG